MQFKFCPRCRLSKSLNDFYKNKSSWDGYQSYCKVCQRSKSAKASKIDSEPSEPLEHSDIPAEELKRSSEPLKAKEPQSRAHNRYQVLRQHSRGTGRCAWKVFDEKAQSVVYFADSLLDAYQHIDRLVDSELAFKLTRYGKTTMVLNDDSGEPAMVGADQSGRADEDGW